MISVSSTSPPPRPAQRRSAALRLSAAGARRRGRDAQADGGTSSSCSWLRRNRTSSAAPASASRRTPARKAACWRANYWMNCRRRKPRCRRSRRRQRPTTASRPQPARAPAARAACAPPRDHARAPRRARPAPAAAARAAAGCARSATTSPSNWSTCRRASRSSAMCGPSWPACAASAIFQAAAPSRPIARGLAGPALLAHVMVSKYCDHHPAVPPERHLRPRRRGAGPLARWPAGWTRATRCIDPLVAALRPLRAGLRQDARRRHAGEGARPRARARPGPAGCGSTCATTGPPATRRRGRPGSPTRPTARASIRRST